MHDINVLSFDLVGRDLSKLTKGYRAILSAPADKMPLAASVEVLADIVRRGGDQPFAFRIPDDARLSAVWHRDRAAALVATYWRHTLAHVDLVITAEVGRVQRSFEVIQFTEAEADAISRRPCPLLVRCRVRRRVPAITEVLGMVAYMPAMLTSVAAS